MTRRNLSRLAPLALLAPQLLKANEARDLLQKVTKRYQSLQSFHFDGKSIAQSAIGNRTTQTETSFTVAFEAPKKFRLEFRYPTAGNWLRVSDGEFFRESRSITKESKRTPFKDLDLHVLKSSPLYNFERLSQTVINPIIMRVVSLDIDEKKTECDLVQFEAGRREMREGELPGPSMVWIARANGLVMREEIRATSKSGENITESKRITVIERFSLDQPLPASLFVSL